MFVGGQTTFEKTIRLEEWLGCKSTIPRSLRGALAESLSQLFELHANMRSFFYLTCYDAGDFKPFAKYDSNRVIFPGLGVENDQKNVKALTRIQMNARLFCRTKLVLTY